MQQGSTEWLNWRNKGLGSSDAAKVMGISPFGTPYQLWAEKTGKLPGGIKSNWAMERGTRLEPVARSLYELQSDLDMPPAEFEHPKYPFLRASLDGYNKDAQVILEIKVAGQKVMDAAKQGEVVDYYYAQIQHQLFVTGAKEAHFFVCKAERVSGVEQITDSALVIVPPDEEWQKNYLISAMGFWQMVEKDIAPVLSADDELVLEDQSSVILFSRVKKLKLELKKQEEYVERAKARLIEIMKAWEELRAEAIEHAEAQSHPRLHSVGVNMTKSTDGRWVVTLAGDKAG